jgi:hypothetical protein
MILQISLLSLLLLLSGLIILPALKPCREEK